MLSERPSISETCYRRWGSTRPTDKVAARLGHAPWARPAATRPELCGSSYAARATRPELRAPSYSHSAWP
jgi:hypothetical protein